MAYVPLTIDSAELARLDAEHDDVFVFRGRSKSPWLAVLRRPSFAETQAYKAMASKPEQKALANVKLITAICVFPKGGCEEWKKQFDRWPFFPDGIADAEDFKEFVGLAVSESEK